jgi:hypothetical protein
VDKTVQEYFREGMLKKWEEVKGKNDGAFPCVVSPISVEPLKPRMIVDARYVNLFCRVGNFSMDCVGKIAQVAKPNIYMGKIDHKKSYLHVPLHKDTWKFFGIKWRGEYYVYTSIPFGASFSPIVYHSLTESVAMYIRSWGIPILVWIDDMWIGAWQNREGKKAAERSIYFVLMVLFHCGYFLGREKCLLEAVQVLVYLGIEVDSVKTSFRVPRDRLEKLWKDLREAMCQSMVSFRTLESLAGKFASMRIAVPAAALYSRAHYMEMRKYDIPHKK